MRRNKHLRKLYRLLERMEQWEQVGPAISQDEWDDFALKLQELKDRIHSCEQDDDLKIPRFRLKQYNRDWKQYNPKTITPNWESNPPENYNH